jgi:hypothetical protein
MEVVGDLVGVVVLKFNVEEVIEDEFAEIHVCDVIELFFHHHL